MRIQLQESGNTTPLCPVERYQGDPLGNWKLNVKVNFNIPLSCQARGDLMDSVLSPPPAPPPMSGKTRPGLLPVSCPASLKTRSCHPLKYPWDRAVSHCDRMNWRLEGAVHLRGAALFISAPPPLHRISPLQSCGYERLSNSVSLLCVFSMIPPHHWSGPMLVEVSLCKLPFGSFCRPCRCVQFSLSSLRLFI